MNQNKEIGKMLILTRKIGETIIIDDEIEIKVLGIKGSQVRLGITADSSISIHRQEIAERIKADIKNNIEVQRPLNAPKPQIALTRTPNITYKKSKC